VFRWLKTYTIVKCIAIKVPSAEELDALAISLSPRAAVCKRRIEGEDGSRENKERDSSNAVDDRRLTSTNTRNAGSSVVKKLAKGNDCEVQRREIVMEEELTLHQVEGKVVQSPAQNRCTDLIVEAFEGSVGIVVAAALPSKDSNGLEDNPDGHSDAGRPPDDGVTKKINLGMLSSPEVNTTAEDRPGLRARIPSVRVGETGVGSPHNLLELPEFAKEAGVSVVDFLDITLQLGMRVTLNIPQTVGQSASTSASHFLLLRSPVRKLNFVREQDTASHNMDKTKLALNGSETLFGDGTSSLLLNNLDSEKIIGVALKSFITISGNFVLPVSLSDGGADVMRMQAAVGWAVVKTNNGTVLDVNRLRKGIPGLGTVDGLAVNS